MSNTCLVYKQYLIGKRTDPCETPKLCTCAPQSAVYSRSDRIVGSLAPNPPELRIERRTLAYSLQYYFVNCVKKCLQKYAGLTTIYKSITYSTYLNYIIIIHELPLHMHVYH